MERKRKGEEVERIRDRGEEVGRRGEERMRSEEWGLEERYKGDKPVLGVAGSRNPDCRREGEEAK